jgi:hypothetical protein
MFATRWLLMLGSLWFLGFAAQADEMRSTRVGELIRQHLPARSSSVNCHGTTFWVNGWLSVLIPISTDGSFTPECFTVVDHPVEGDVGVLQMNLAGAILFGHSFTLLDQTHAFHKANPGPRYPWTIVDVPSPSGARSVMDVTHSGSDLVYYRFSPRRGCWVTEVQAQIDRWRTDPDFGGLVRVLEAAAVGRSDVSDDRSYAARFEQLDRLASGWQGPRPAESSPTYALAVMFLEYLALDRFQSEQRVFEEVRLSEARRVFASVLRVMRDSNQLSPVLKQIIASARLRYDVTNRDIFGTSRSATLDIPMADFANLASFDIQGGGLHVTARGFNLEVRTPRQQWTFGFNNREDYDTAHPNLAH